MSSRTLAAELVACSLFLVIVFSNAYASGAQSRPAANSLFFFPKQNKVKRSADAAVAQIANRFIAQKLAFDPTISAFTGLTPSDGSRFSDRTVQSLLAIDVKEQKDLVALLMVNPVNLSEAAHATYANLREQIESDLGLRICRSELWNVSHYGWQSELAAIADAQPIATLKDRRAALARWASMGRFVDIEISNLRTGLSVGYAAPKSLVSRVIRQLDQLAPSDLEKSPLYTPVLRSQDPAFQRKFSRVIADRVNPAIHRYRDFLREVYWPQARIGTAIADLPNGPACYRALLRSRTTLNRGPEDVFEIGQKTVTSNLTYVQSVGEKAYGTSDVVALLTAIKKKQSEHFQSADDLLAFSRAFFERSERLTAATLVDILPAPPVVIQPLPAFEEASGVNSRFVEDPNPTKPSIFFIQLGIWKEETRAEAEIVTVHESIPGHALQKGIAAALASPTRLSRFIDNSAYVEGWARYAEALSEEAHIYGFEGGDAVDAVILRRLWPARGMVVDPGLNAFGWTREQAIKYIMEAGQDTYATADDLVDRIAAMPGQLTSYDSGGLEILNLRVEAEQRLGSHFNLREFNHTLLDDGVVPLPELRRHVQRWIAEKAEMP